MTEHELAARNAEAANRMMPGVGPILDNLLRSHLRDQVRRQAITAEELSAGVTTATRDVFVAFVDVVGFTRLGERIGAVTLGELVGRLSEMAEDVAADDVQLVKTVGDAAMFVGGAPAAVVGAALDLVERADAAEDFPAVRAARRAGRPSAATATGTAAREPGQPRHERRPAVERAGDAGGARCGPRTASAGRRSEHAA